jgi:hypothetical protein
LGLGVRVAEIHGDDVGRLAGLQRADLLVQPKRREV